MKYSGDDYLLMRYLGMSVDDISSLDSYRKKSYVDAIKDNISKTRRSARVNKIKNIFI